jgi:hypothetical protein
VEGEARGTFGWCSLNFREDLHFGDSGVDPEQGDTAPRAGGFPQPSGASRYGQGVIVEEFRVERPRFSHLHGWRHRGS